MVPLFPHPWTVRIISVYLFCTGLDTFDSFFQVPVFILGIRGLWKGKKTYYIIFSVPADLRLDSCAIYLLLLIYGASTSTTLLPCLAVLLGTPITSPETIAANVISVTWSQKQLLLTSYIPFLILPLLMTVDMALRISKLVQIGIRVQDNTKKQ